MGENGQRKTDVAAGLGQEMCCVKIKIAYMTNVIVNKVACTLVKAK